MTGGRGGRRKRERSTSVAPPPLSKRLRGSSSAGDPPPSASAAPSEVVVTGLPSDCTVLELKSRLQQFGSISRMKIDGSGSGHVTFRSDAAAQAAILASLEPGLGISVGSCKVLVVRPSKQEKTEIATNSLSPLLRPEPPLRKYGRSNRKLADGELVQSTGFEPELGSAIPSTRADPDLRPNSREIVAYDDLF
ncbi:hypothetical protein LUZ61_002548 [Rhynchospora tenuis]|uniref:RRM domain-containing protein n=1 Tax=Rhynchospora tenuis TaxID=198213 RepID=A0AAD5ZJA7_9POAL|nr:hypothetical protein LUZ61_002548 [Rhynchospora tenuis]